MTHPPPTNSKLPRFLHRNQNRDRAKSVNDAASTSSSSSLAQSESTKSRMSSQRGSRLAGVKEKENTFSKKKGVNDSDSDINHDPAGDDEPTNIPPDEFDPPIIVEQPKSPYSHLVVPRLRTRSERPVSIASPPYNSAESAGNPSYNIHTSPSARGLTDMTSRLSGWIQHAFSASSTDLSSLTSLPYNPHPLSQSQPASSPKSSKAATIMAHLPGKANLERAVRYLLDSDIAQPDKCRDPIWLMGVHHPGYEAPLSILPPPPQTPGSTTPPRNHHNRDSTDSSIPQPSVHSTPSPSNSPTAELNLQSLSLARTSSPQQALAQSIARPAPLWPQAFYTDFASCIWLTYRSQYAPIRSTSLEALTKEHGSPSGVSTLSVPVPIPSASPGAKSKWSWATGPFGGKEWTADTGWGCMLRTGQSLLANSLIHLHLGRDWRRSAPSHTQEYATYVQILTWFFDTPSPLAPFSVHRMALAGKDLGKEVGTWFGPSTAAGSIKTLVHAFPEARLAVSLASDSVIFESDVYAASNLHSGTLSDLPASPSHTSSSSAKARRGRERWGGRAVLVLINIRLGIEGVNPIYYESVKALFKFPQSVGIAGGRPSSSYYFVGAQANSLFYLDPHHTRPAIALQPPPNEKDDLPNVSHRRSSTEANISARHVPATPPRSNSRFMDPPQTAPVTQIQSSFVQSQLSSSTSSTATSATITGPPLPPLAHHFATAYSPADLNTFHCDRVRKMPLSGLDPSMLLGFLCKNESDWKDFRLRVNELSKNHQAIFSIVDEPPMWPDDSDDDMGLESLSEPDIDTDERSTAEDEFFEDGSEIRGDPTFAREGSQGAEGESDEEESVITPGPVHPPTLTSSRDPSEEDEDWEDPIQDTPINGMQSTVRTLKPSTSSPRPPTLQQPAPPPQRPMHASVQQFPFPRTEPDHGPPLATPQPQPRSLRGRHGGRTASGGVKAIS